MVQEDILAILVPGRDPGPVPVLVAPSGAEAGGEILTENEDTLIVVARVDQEVGATVGTITPGEVGGATSRCPRSHGEDRHIPGVQVHISQNHVPILGIGLIPIPEASLGPVPEVLSHLLESRDWLLLQGALVQQNQILVPELEALR